MEHRPEKRIEEEHYSDPDTYNARYAFGPQSERENSSSTPRRLTPQAHIGAVAQYSMIDVSPGANAAAGSPAQGVGHNGINIEFTVEKNTKRKMRTYDRGEFRTSAPRPLKPSRKPCGPPRSALACPVI